MIENNIVHSTHYLYWNAHSSHQRKLFMIHQVKSQIVTQQTTGIHGTHVVSTRNEEEVSVVETSVTRTFFMSASISSMEVSFSAVKVKSTTETSGVGTRKAIPRGDAGGLPKHHWGCGQFHRVAAKRTHGCSTHGSPSIAGGWAVVHIAHKPIPVWERFKKRSSGVPPAAATIANQQQTAAPD